MFWQSLFQDHSPFCMVGPVINFILEETCRPLKVSLVIPFTDPTPVWWPILMANTTLIQVAVKGDEQSILMPTKMGYQYRPLLYDMFIARFDLPPKQSC